MGLVFDTGALIALERNDRPMWRRLKAALIAEVPPVSHGGVIAQAWRGGGKQALLAQAIGAIDVRGIDTALGRETGTLLARSRTRDVIDAALIVIARDGDQVFTSDPVDLALLARAADREVEIIEV